MLARDMNQTEKDELLKYWHTARIAGHMTRFDRLNYAVSEFVKTHPEYNRTGVYKLISDVTVGYGL